MCEEAGDCSRRFSLRICPSIFSKGTCLTMKRLCIVGIVEEETYVGKDLNMKEACRVWVPREVSRILCPWLRGPIAGDCDVGRDRLVDTEPSLPFPRHHSRSRPP